MLDGKGHSKNNKEILIIMGQIRITQYIHRPNKTELGIGNTHECYMLVASDIDMSDIFPPSQDVTIYDTTTLKEYILKSSNYREFRINQMGDIYRDYNVMPGDEIIINQVKKEGYSNLNFSVKHYNRVVLLVKKGVAEINNIERLKPYEKAEREYELSIVDRGNVSKLLVSFQGAMPKRADSPTMTDYYNVYIDGERMPNGTYYLTLEGDKNVLANLPKSNFNTIEFDDKTIDSMKAKIKPNKITAPLQQIYYGAPGTGKSYEIDKITKKYGAIRTTFHPDSDYSTFVGAYKPTMTKVELRDMSGHLVKEEGTTRVVKEDRITYKFVKQAFLKAYLSAWKKYADGDESGVEPQFLVIEEINRGNCAQIFGDLFQLLDRQDNGFSSYPIEADADLQREIAEAFKAEKDYMLTKELNLQGVVKDYVGNLAEDIKSGKILLLPSNFYIWATMNTSDQSLFPIDSAFKRRWDWHYVKIADAKKDYKIKCGDEVCDWWTFVQAVNEKIAEETSSDDKKLGYFFCKPQNEGEPIGVERFVSKVLFYLWNDVFKDGNTTDFNVSDNSNKQPSFDAFYNDDNTINIENVRKFLVNIVREDGLQKVSEKGFEEYQNEDIENGDGDGKDHTKYAINGEGRISKRKIAVELVKKYIDINPTLSAKEVAATWKMLGNEININYIVETQEDYNNDTRTTKNDRLEKIVCNGEPLWVGTHGWGTVEKMNELKAALSKRNWGLSISEIQE